MRRPSVYVTRPLPKEAIRLLEERCDVEMADEQPLSGGEFLDKLKGRDAVLVSGSKIDEQICREIKAECKILANYGVGYDNIDVKAATKHGIYVSNTPGVVTDATADLAFALLLAVARRVAECDRYVRSGAKGWGPSNLLGAQVSGKTIGIIGGGRIGVAVGQRAKGFGMKIMYYSSKPNLAFEQVTGGKYADKASLLAAADFISLHVPLLPSTRHLLDEADFKAMKKTAIVINTSRGAVINETALVNALAKGEIAGAGLDVFEREPELAPGLASLPNVVLTPHVGTSTMDTRVEMGERCASNIFAALDGQTPPTCVNPEAKANRVQ